MGCITSKQVMKFRRADIRKFLLSVTYRAVAGKSILTGE
jgi:hypothetical protein